MSARSTTANIETAYFAAIGEDGFEPGDWPADRRLHISLLGLPAFVKEPPRSGFGFGAVTLATTLQCQVPRQPPLPDWSGFAAASAGVSRFSLLSLLLE